MSGKVVISDFWHGYLAFAPYDGAPTWPCEVQHAQVLSEADAASALRVLPAEWQLRIEDDYYRREPWPVPVKAQIHGEGWCECHCETCGRALDETHWCDNCDEPPARSSDDVSAAERFSLEMDAAMAALKLK